MISRRLRCGLVHLKGYIYAIGGDDAKETAEKYDPSRDEWTTIPPLPHPMCRDFCSVALGDSIYVIGEFEEGCYSFSTTNNVWNKITNRNMPASYPQAVMYQGSIYCTGNMGPMIGVVPEIYNPAKDEWKQSGKYGFASHATIMARYGETLYLLKVHRNTNLYAMRTSIDINQYQPETDSWQSDIDSRQRQSVQDKSSLVPPMARWLGSMGLRHTLQVHCLTARMVPQCLRHYGTEIYKDPPSHGEEGSGISDDSNGEDDLSEQEDDGSGSDNGNI
ncbi:kelch repeat and BTB domain-containing protein 2-like [Branchiostoma floridae]|uniref:Kelch repeat and BTB domain-containing protein 2-like n=1 Tax=Branchiostoma floridae TaxID=7739 RepID=A0A9J7LA41_BRAFL|nr:kelch repeat and BTB domain-containing protein 2-like [Branchiostoma floridae]